MSGQVDVLAVIAQAAAALKYAGAKHAGVQQVIEARAAVAALIAERDALNERLNTNRCNRGHETLPLTLWDCPECHNETRRERDALREACQTMVDWDDAENNARPYAEDNGKAWRERLDLCALAFRRARSALALPTGESA